MPSSVRQRLTSLLLPLVLAALCLMLSGMWLGYGWAMQMAAQPTGDGTLAWPWALWLHLVLPALLMLGAVLAVASVVLRRAFSPWVSLAQMLQARAPRDLRSLEMAPHAPADVQAMARVINHLLERLREESDAQQRFIADAAHQLRTPLAALQSQVEAWALMAQAAPEKSIQLQADQVERLRQASRRTSQLAHQLLALSRVGSGLHQDAAPQRVDLKHLCETLLESFWDSAMAKGLDLGLDVASAHVTGQAWLLRELLANILDNAIQYTPAGGRVTLRCGQRMQGAHLQAFLEVEDDGPGVPCSEYARLTRRFYRVPGAPGEGSGLGLAIAQEIAQMHGALLCFTQVNNVGGMRVFVGFTT